MAGKLLVFLLLGCVVSNCLARSLKETDKFKDGSGSGREEALVLAMEVVSVVGLVTVEVLEVGMVAA